MSEIGEVSDSALGLLATYGWAMFAVQSFEYNLAGLSVLTNPVKSPQRLLDTPEKANLATS